MAKMKSAFQSLVPLLVMVRDADMQKLAITNQKMESLEKEIRSLRANARSNWSGESNCRGSNFRTQNNWRDWLAKRRQVLSLELIHLAADREFQKEKLAVAYGRADVVVELAKRKPKGSWK
ncbi:MAG: hypothetical protein KUG69_01095 [Marinosulfonomonas sp.]|nr:hypothetical protein [Marinosulfonomonas sp.]